MGLNTPSGSTGASAPTVMIVNNVNKSKEDKEKPRTKEENKDK